uniref:Uncharacterized protein n=1 Tax=Spironucleus salmonicida TaxID=348837 RepID=V6LVU9_9EUKA|eukprot:EST48373.1 Hypothetical protein SS50377_11447 [Spironucleus salmonicida]
MYQQYRYNFFVKIWEFASYLRELCNYLENRMSRTTFRNLQSSSEMEFSVGYLGYCIDLEEERLQGVTVGWR